MNVDKGGPAAAGDAEMGSACGASKRVLPAGSLKLASRRYIVEMYNV